ncbi:TonB-dependent siderophore receptor [Neorhizobium sp. NPDC001467]|uniref:TonB-dependent siderophore receptor n=1 Tax=Neorhizobium sp. NPDC001467 TaxID=3390595 RepID=UPI003D08C417
MAPRLITSPRRSARSGAALVGRSLAAALLSSSALLLASQALAQTADAGGTTTLETIDVTDSGNTGIGPDSTIVAKGSRTSSKTDTPLLDAPASVSVVTQRELEIRGVKTLDEAVAYTPGVSSDIYGSDNRYDYFQIRGFYSSGRTFRDGLPMRINVFTGSRSEPYGLQRVEVLKGANSTLFGLSEPGGIVNTVTKRPQDVKFGEVYTTVGEDHVETGIDFGGPIDADGIWTYRLTAKGQDGSSDYDFLDDDRIYIAPALTFAPTDDTDFTLLTNYMRRDGATAHSIPYSLRGQIDSETYLGEPTFDAMDTEEWNIGYEFRHNFGNGFEFRQNMRYTDIGLVYKQVFPGGALPTDRRSAYGVTGNVQRFDIDNQLQYDASFGAFDSKTLFGLSYAHDDASSAGYYNLPFRDPVTGIVSGGIDPIDPFNPVYTGVDMSGIAPLLARGSQAAKSIYLQEELTIDKQWIITAGTRYDYVETNDKLSGPDSVDEAVTSRLGLTYKASDEVSLYASYQESFLPLGADRTAFLTPPKPQEGTQYELGVKYQPQGMDALFTAAVFDLTQSNLAQSIGGTPFQNQLGEVNVRGLELEAKVALTNQLNLTAAYTYLDAEIKADANAAIVGNRPEIVPKHMASAWVDYTIPGNGTLGDLTLGAGARFVAGIEADNENTITLPSRTVFDVAAKYMVTDNVALSLNVENLFDKEYITEIGFNDSAFYGNRRAYRASLRYTW